MVKGSKSLGGDHEKAQALAIPGLFFDTFGSLFVAYS